MRDFLIWPEKSLNETQNIKMNENLWKQLENMQYVIPKMPNKMCINKYFFNPNKLYFNSCEP